MSERDHIQRIASQWDNVARIPSFFDETSLKYGLKRDISPLQFFYWAGLRSLQGHFRKVLDIGCGGGNQAHNLFLLNKADRIDGCDVSGESIEASKQLHAKFGNLDRVRLFQESFETFKGEPPYDLVIAMQLLGYQRDLDTFFQRLGDFAADDSLIVIADGQKTKTPLEFIKRSKENARIRRFFNKAPLPPSDVTLWGFEAVEKTASRYGYRRLTVHYAKHHLARVLDRLLFRLSRAKYRQPWVRNMANYLYRAIALICRLETRLLRNQRSGQVFFAVFRKE